MTVAEFVERLDGAKKNGHGWEARCPAHEDGRASLSVAEGEDGRVLLHCHAGCECRAVVLALGLTESDLFSDHQEETGRGRIVAAYDYTDEKGTLLFQVVRLDPKDFRQRRPGGAGWSWNLNGVHRVLFRLQRVVEAASKGSVVFVVEGEKDVLALEKLGIVATCNPGGAGKWRDEFSACLVGLKGAVVIPDRDAPGEKHAQTVAASLHAAGVPVKVLELPTGKDVADWIEAGGTKAALSTLVKAAPKWVPAAASVPPKEDEARTRRVVVTRASDIAPVPVTWTWQDRIPAGMVSLVAGRESTGKTGMVLDRAARLSRGDLEGIHRGAPRSVVVVAAEDSWAHTIRPRLEAAGADCDRVLRVQIHVQDLGACELSLPDDVDALRDTIRAHDVAMVVLDPMISRLSRRLDTHKDAEVRLALEPLSRLADETGVAVVGVIHVGKGMTRDPLTAVMGSRGFVALARAVLFVAVDPEDRTRRILSQVKCNVGRDDTAGLESLTYKIEAATVETARGPAQTSRIVWTGVSPKGVREILAADEPGRGEARKAAEDWLAELLADGPMASEDVRAAAGEAGLSWGTVRRAQENLRIKPTKAGGRFGGDPRWYWELPLRPVAPEDAQPPLKMLTSNKCAPSGTSEHLQAAETSTITPGVPDPGERL